MCKTLIFTVLASLLILITPVFTFAQESNSAVSEEVKGKEILQKLQDKQLSCQNLSSDDFEKLGEYFMGQMAGNSHESMNKMMERTTGKEGEEQMHIVIGKRLSGCDTERKGGGNPMMGQGWGGMMSGWGGFGILGWLSMLIFWVLLILGVVALIRYLARSGQSGEDKTPLDMLKERYAKGEINKKEFEEKKKDLA